MVINRKKIDQNTELYKITIQTLANNLNTVKTFHYLNEINYRLNKELDKEEKLTEQRGESLIQELASIFYSTLDILGFKFELVSYNSKIYYLLDK